MILPLSKEKKDALGEYLLPSFLTLVIFLTVLAVKKIFPFGGNTIDYYDMGQTNAPLYYHIWDVLHFKSDLFYTWYINEGQNLSMASAIQWNISVFNLFFLFIPRHLCYKALGLFTGLRLFFMSFNMGIFLKKTMKAPPVYRMAMSLAYGLCGYTLTHYTIPTYLDTAALFPLYILGLYYVLKEDNDKIFWDFKLSRRSIFALSTGYMTALSYYLGFMNLIFILLVSGTYIFIMAKKESRIRISADLAISVITGLLISSFILLPAALQMTGSSRFNSNLSGSLFENLKNILFSVGADMYYIKWFILSGSIAAMVITAFGIVRIRKEKKTLFFVLLVCFYPCCLIPFESINLLWHMGTYYHYPIRCGYLIPFVLLCAGAYFSGRLFNESKPELSVWEYIIFPIGCALIAGGVVIVTIIIYKGRVWGIHELFKAWIVFAVIMALFYIVCIIIRRPGYISVFMAAELVCAAYIGFGCPNFHDKFSSEPEQSGEYINTINDLKKDLDIFESCTKRIKNPDTELNTNYGMVIRRATVGGWANTARRQQLEAAMAFGYNAHFMRIMDSGGTLFSDTMLHITQVLTCVPDLYENDEYEKEKESGEYVLFNMKYKLPFVMKIKNTFEGAKGSINDIPKTTNTYYKELCDMAGLPSDETILKTYSEKDIYADGKQALYLQGGQSEEITVNGKKIPVPTMGDKHNLKYPASFNSNLLYLGIYENEDVRIEGIDDAVIMGLELEKLEKLCKAYKNLGVDDRDIDVTVKSLNFKINADKNETAIVPLTYDRGVTAVVNGKKKAVKNIDSMFTGIELDEGENTVEILFIPYGFRLGVFLSLAGVMYALFALNIVKSRVLDKILYFMLAAAFFTSVIILYVVPLGVFVIHQVVKRVHI